MTAKLKNILDAVNDFVSYKEERTMSDDDFIADIDAANLLCNLYDELGIDRTEIRRKMDILYPEFSRRIYGKKNMQLSMPLIKAFDRYIYGRRADNDDRGSINSRNELVEQCRKVVAAYRKAPLMHSSDYLYALLRASDIDDRDIDEANKEYQDILNGYIADIDVVAAEEQIRRAWAYDKSRWHVASDREKWAEIRESLKYVDVSELDDGTFLLWCGVTKQRPLKEFKRRSDNSKRMQVEYLRSLAYSEIRKEHRAAEKRNLNRALKGLNDDIIGGITDIKIGADMSVSALYALEIIYFLRLQLAQVAGDSKEPVYESLCRDRYEQIAKVLTNKYLQAATINEQIEILERLEAIEMFVSNEHSRFALEECENLKGLPDLTCSQEFRLSWMFGLESDNLEGTINKLLLQTKDAFDLKTLSDIEMFGTYSQRKAVMDLYGNMFEKVISANNTDELGRLLTTGACWNSDPARRPTLVKVANKAETVSGLSLPEKRVIPTAAKILSRIDTLIGKHTI